MIGSGVGGNDGGQLVSKTLGGWTAESRGVGGLCLVLLWWEDVCSKHGVMAVSTDSRNLTNDDRTVG